MGGLFSALITVFTELIFRPIFSLVLRSIEIWSRGFLKLSSFTCESKKGFSRRKSEISRKL